MFLETGEKKTLTKFGKLEIVNAHAFSKGCNGYQISPFLQELMIYAGQLDSYQLCNEILQKFLDIQVSATQVFRVTNTYGEQIVKDDQIPNTLPLKKDEVLYAQADGSMIFTREDGWKEVKVGRLFKAEDRLKITSKKGWIKKSHYVAHLGNSKDFIEKMESRIDNYGCLNKRLVFISDGAAWIKNWVADSYPQAIQILDYYHACEHLYAFCNEYFDDKTQGRLYSKQQEKILLKSQVIKVIKNLEALPVKNKQTTKHCLQLIQYYQNNKDRMDYKYYKQIGCAIIGSGAIEAAHRTVVQRRLKLSGQRWNKSGAQNVLNLRTSEMSGEWYKIINLVKTEFKKAA